MDLQHGMLDFHVLRFILLEQAIADTRLAHKAFEGKKKRLHAYFKEQIRLEKGYPVLGETMLIMPSTNRIIGLSVK